VKPALLARLVKLPDCPDTARQLVSVCGMKAAAALITEWPGLEMPMPSVEGGGCPAGERRWAQLVEIVGEEAARALLRRYRGDRVYIPSLSRVKANYARTYVHEEYERLVMGLADGKHRYTHDQAINEIALKTGVASRSIERWLARPAVTDTPQW
jgi:hypothetical protein